MKFVSLCTLKDSVSIVPPAKIRQLVEASIEWSNQLKKEGKLLELYSLPGGRTLAICEHSSAEDLNQTLTSMPIGIYMNFEVFPLADFNITMKALVEVLKAGERMAPSKEMAGVH